MPTKPVAGLASVTTHTATLEMDGPRHWASHKVTGLSSKKDGAPGSRVQREDDRPTTLCIPLLITTQMGDHGWRIWHHLLPPRTTMVSPASRSWMPDPREDGTTVVMIYCVRAHVGGIL